MQKIPSVFVRDSENKECQATEVVEPGCEWVLDGEGVATVKWDGTACLVLSSTLYQRHRVKSGKEPPPRWFHWSTVGSVPTDKIPHPRWFRRSTVEQKGAPGIHYPPPNSGHGWIAVYSSPADVHHRQAWRVAEGALEDGTYELIGPQVQKNPYGLKKHVLVRHGALLVDVPELTTTYEGIREALGALPHEGIVFHHPDGRMAKVKREQFGLPWPNYAAGPVAEQGAIPGFARGTI